MLRAGRAGRGRLGSDMSRIQDRKKQRREYLRKKGVAYTKMSLTTLLMLSCAYCAFFSFIALLVFGYQWQAFVLSASLSVIFAGGCWRSVRAVRLAHRTAKQLPYVPPVISATLPAEEVLLRGSDALTQEQSQVLLRGTQNTEEADGQELLRSSQEQAGQ